MQSRHIFDNTYVSVSSEYLNILKMDDFLQNPQHGAISIFIGKIRNCNFNRPVLGVSYDVFEPLAIKTFQDICENSRNKWGNQLRIYLEHFKGRLDVGGISILIGVSSIHRAEAIHVCSYIIEQVKHKSPIWKQEHYECNNSEWTKGHSLCKHSHGDQVI